MDASGTFLREFFRPANPFLLLGLVWLGFFSLLSHKIYTAKPETLPQIHWARNLYMRMLPGFGALTGWISVGYLWTVNWEDPQWEHLVIGAVAFLGITGNIPLVIFLNTFLRQSMSPAQTPPTPKQRPGSPDVND